jgi:hypothetical protein
MTKLQELRTNILAIPDKRMRSDFVGTLRQYCEKARTSRTALENAIRGQNQIAYVFEADLSDSISKASKAISTAKNLASRVSKDPKIIQGRGTDTSIANISSLADSALSDLKSQWRKLLLGRIRTFRSLVEAAEEAKLQGGLRLRNLLDSMEERANNPPFSHEQAEATKQQLDDLVRSISAIGLEGEVGAFLISAANGSANPQALYNPEVKEFIDRHDLWRMLRVKLS